MNDRQLYVLNVARGLAARGVEPTVGAVARESGYSRVLVEHVRCVVGPLGLWPWGGSWGDPRGGLEGDDPEAGLPDPPSPEEIAAESGEIRKGWDEAEVARRSAWDREVLARTVRVHAVIQDYFDRVRKRLPRGYA